MSTDRSNAFRLSSAYAALLLYASFYPFEFNLGRLAHASLTWGYSSFGDRLINLLAYIPLGFLLAAARWRVPFAAAFGFGMSLAVELGQNATQWRNPNLYDLFFNSAGTLLGALLCLPVRDWLAGQLARLRLADLLSPAGLLLLLWLALHAAPFIGVIDRAKLLNSFDERWSWLGIFHWTAMWVVFTNAVLRLFRSRWIVPLAALSMLTRFFFLRQHLEMNEVLGLLPGVALSRVPGIFVFSTIAMLVPGRLLETAFLAAGSGWLAAARFKRTSVVSQG